MAAREVVTYLYPGRATDTMVDPVLAVALALLVLGVVASVVPLVPGALLSLTGIYLYWWLSGFAEPGVAFLVVATLVGVTALVLDFLSSAISAKVGGASLRTTAIAAIVGVLLLVTTGPIGALLGVTGTVFLLEFAAHRDAERGARTALYTTLGMLTSSVVQVLLTATLMVTFVVVVWW